MNVTDHEKSPAADVALRRRMHTALGVGAWGADELGEAVLRPAGREPVRLAARILAENRRPWAPRGGGRRTPPGNRLAVQAPSGIFDFWAGDLVARVGAGTTFAQLDELLAGTGLCLGSSVPLPERATLGGSFASGEIGWPGGVGRCLRDLVLACTAVDGTGRLYKAGARVVKNVAGYDLVRLHHGAAGSFGIVLDVVVRLRARAPEQRLRWRELPISRLVEAWAESISAPPSTTLFLDGGAASRFGLGAKSGALLLEEGTPDRLNRWEQRMSGEPCELPLEGLRDLGWRLPGDISLLRWLAPPSVLVDLWPRAQRALEANGHQTALIFALESGHGRLVLIGRPRAGSIEILRELGARSLERGGSLWIDRWSAESLPEGSLADDDPRARRLRSVFDPHGLLPPLPRPLRHERR